MGYKNAGGGSRPHFFRMGCARSDDLQTAATIDDQQQTIDDLQQAIADQQQTIAQITQERAEDKKLIAELQAKLRNR